uniref:Aspartyl beta-hydroxylase/Triadin domain-containing protein n=1 Tax=Amphiprion ocellaris TaxID=80972 RepID=A0AAQ6ARH9_AMPOC
MGDPATLVESTTPPVTTGPTMIAGEMQVEEPARSRPADQTAEEDKAAWRSWWGPGGWFQDGAKAQSANKNGKKVDSGCSSSSFFTWFIVLALLGVWTSVAVVYFDLVDYQGVLGKLVAYDTDGDGDFDVEDAKVLLDKQSGVHGVRKRSRNRDEKPGDEARRGAKKETSTSKDVGWKLREALKQQLAIIHERVEAKKLAKLALAEVRQLLAKEEEEKELELGRKEISARVKERVATRLKEEEEKMEKEEMEKALEKLHKEKAEQPDEKKEETSKEEKAGDKKSKKGGEKEEKSEKEGEGEGNKAQEEDMERGKELAREKRKKSKADKSDRGGKK